MVGTPPADMSDVNATWLGRMEHSTTAAKTNMTVTAFLGCPSAFTRPIQLERGNTPSRATAKMSREEATTAMLVFCAARDAKKRKNINNNSSSESHDISKR